MSRLGACFDALRTHGRRALVTYITAGDPAPQSTAGLLHALAESGADILELGVPFSDPTADGAAIQAAHERAIAHGVRLADALDMVADFRRTNDTTPIVLMGYLNPIEAMGAAAFADAAAAAGVDGVIAVDLPPEEAEPLRALLRERGLDLIFLIAPTTTAARMARIAEIASGFIYYVSLKGTTGAGHLDTAAVADKLADIHARTELPVAAGFGVRNGAAAAALAPVADAVVVGSALIERIVAADNDAARCHAAGDFVGELRAALDKAMTATAV
ncbi:MAG TPA: tryptophan synthase subunit alpha [Gammaproteobacteria bacterium]|nr:tryptophan synthase subunit alpha [Gammaproteobacteria bacterium]